MISAWAFLKSLRDKHIFGCRRKSGGEVGGEREETPRERECVGGRKGKGGGNDSGNTS